MADLRLRELERQASSGDPGATRRAAAERVRMGGCAWCGAPKTEESAECCCYECFEEGSRVGRREPGIRWCKNCPRPKHNEQLRG